MTQALVGLLVAFLIWMATPYDWSFWYILAGVAAGWFLFFREHTATAGGGSGFGAAITNAVRGFFGTTERLAVFTFVFIGLMMLVGRFTGNSPFSVSNDLHHLGWRVWLWPDNIGLTVLLFVCSIALTGGIAIMTARGNWRIAGILFGLGFVVIVLIMNFEPVAESIRPKPTTPLVAAPGGPTPTKWDDATHALAERGVPSVAAEAAAKLTLGNGRGVQTKGVLGEGASRTGEFLLGTPADKKKSGVVGSFFNRSWAWAFGESEKPSKSTTSTEPPTPAPAGPTPMFHQFGADGCYERDLGLGPKWSPDKGTMRVFDPAGGSHLETLGQKVQTSAFGPGHWKFCAGPDATGVVIWE